MKVVTYSSSRGHLSEWPHPSPVAVQILQKNLPPPPAEGLFVSRLFVDVEDRRIVLNLAQTFVRCVPQVAIIGPTTKLDFSDQGRLRKDKVSALERHNRLFRLQFIERPFEVGPIVLLKAGPDRANRNPPRSLASGKQKAPDPATGALDCS